MYRGRRSTVDAHRRGFSTNNTLGTIGTKLVLSCLLFFSQVLECAFNAALIESLCPAPYAKLRYVVDIFLMHDSKQRIRRSVPSGALLRDFSGGRTEFHSAWGLRRQSLCGVRRSTSHYRQWSLMPCRACHRCCRPSRFHPSHSVPAINMPTLSSHIRKGV